MRCLSFLTFVVFAACECRDAFAQDVPVEEFAEPLLLTGSENRLEFRVDYLYWWLNRLQTPPLLTMGPAGSSAIVGQPGTTILRGGERITSRHDRYIGVRGGLDWWFGEDRVWGAELDVFFLERDSTHYTIRHGQVPTLAIPYIDERGQNNSFVVSGTNREYGSLNGSTRVYSRMELFGQEGNILYKFARTEDSDWNLFAGMRALQLRERLDLTSSASILPAQTTVIGLEDHFQTFNKFYGAQLGASGRLRAGRWFLEGRGAIALGLNDQQIQNKGQFIYHTPQARTAQPYGLFVQPSNTGGFDNVSFDVVTEARLKVGCAITRWLNVEVGYSFLSWAGPVRPGQQVVPINRTQTQPGGLQGTLQPLPQFKEDFFWAHGLNTGLEVRW